MKIDSMPQISNVPSHSGRDEKTGIKGVPVGNDLPKLKPTNDKAEIDILKKVYGEKMLKQVGVVECATCAARTYVDGSDDPSVSFKTPGKIAPEQAASVVMGHELEHVSNEKADAAANDREIVSQSVSLSTAICPECGKSYVSGGTTRTTTKSKEPYKPSIDLLKGLKMDQMG